ncbi:MAG: YscO family type III secretion system apparatus protein [Reinekea sp.]|jgi:type III secretion protein O
MLSKIEAIKKLRETNAQTAVKRQRTILAESDQALRDAEDALVQYKEWRIEEEQRLYQEIIGSSVEMKGLEKVKSQIGKLRQEEENFKKRIIDAKQERDRAEQDLHRAELALHEANKALEKCQELVKQIAKDTLAKALRGEENELEEACEGLYTNRSQLA